MAGAFRVLSTPAFERESRAIVRKDSTLVRALEELIDILGNDPHTLEAKSCCIPYATGKARIDGRACPEERSASGVVEEEVEMCQSPWRGCDNSKIRMELMQNAGEPRQARPLEGRHSQVR